jgi:hypothetical protein
MARRDDDLLLMRGALRRRWLSGIDGGDAVELAKDRVLGRPEQDAVRDRLVEGCVCVG